jgi:hypothetical protein
VGGGGVDGFNKFSVGGLEAKNNNSNRSINNSTGLKVKQLIEGVSQIRHEKIAAGSAEK